jgi:putative hydrolase of HD superfamily
MKANVDLLALVTELQALDRLPRTGYAMRGVAQPESLAEHGFHVAVLAWALALDEPGLDRLRVLELALVHDLAEVRMGDLPAPSGRYLPRQHKVAGELAAAVEILAPLGSGASDLLAEYQAAETREAKFVVACDKLQLLLKSTTYLRWGYPAVAEIVDALTPFPDGGFASVRTLAEQVLRNAADLRESKSGLPDRVRKC